MSVAAAAAPVVDGLALAAVVAEDALAKLLLVDAWELSRHLAVAELLLAIFLHHHLRICHAQVILCERHAADHGRLLCMRRIVADIDHVSSAAMAA